MKEQKQKEAFRSQKMLDHESNDYIRRGLAFEGSTTGADRLTEKQTKIQEEILGIIKKPNPKKALTF